MILKVLDHFKVFLNSTEELGDGFRMQCPGVYKRLPYKMMVFYNGTVSKGANYKDICAEQRTARLAYGNDYPKFFMVDKKSDSMVELEKIEDGSNMKVMIWEIYKSFFDNNKISPSFVDANYTHDVVDEETGEKIGPMGTVSDLQEYKKIKIIFVFSDLQLKNKNLA